MLGGPIFRNRFSKTHTISFAALFLGLFLISEISDLPINAGLYRDDLLSVCSMSDRQTEKVGHRLREIFKKHGLGLKVEPNLKVTEFLDVLLDLNSGTYRAWIKPEQIINYVHKESNHPAHIIKNIPLEVQRRLNLLSSNIDMLEASKGPFHEALERAR